MKMVDIGVFASDILGEKQVKEQRKKAREKKDYSKILDKNTYETFERLRGYRKQIAKDDAVPPFAVFTDVELIEISKLKEITSEQMIKIKGIGLRKVEKYGNKLVEMNKKDEKKG